MSELWNRNLSVFTRFIFQSSVSKTRTLKASMMRRRKSEQDLMFPQYLQEVQAKQDCLKRKWNGKSAEKWFTLSLFRGNSSAQDGNRKLLMWFLFLQAKWEKHWQKQEIVLSRIVLKSWELDWWWWSSLQEGWTSRSRFGNNLRRAGSN